LLQHPIVESLWKTEHEWLIMLLISFNKGDLQGFNKLDQKYFSSEIKSQISFLTTKIKLMAFLELVFQTNVSSRTISFDTISKFTDTDNEDIEELILNALALNLIKGVIDEVTQSVSISWCQPRVLDLSQISNINKNINLWLDKVQNTLDFLKKEGSLKNK